jgi:outer membrane protein assembly factor BamB
MKRLAGAMIAGVLLAPVLLAQELPRIFSRPRIPTPEALNGLGLQLAWRTFVPTDGRRDGLFSVQVLDDMVLVQTYSGAMVALDLADGGSRWRTQVGIAYRTTHRPAVNAGSVVVYNGIVLYGLDRKTGQVQWQFSPQRGPSAAPAADNERIYLPLGRGRLDTFEVPRAAAAPAPGEAPKPESTAVPPPLPQPTPPEAGGTPSSGNPPAGPPPGTPETGPAPLPSTLPSYLWTYQVGGLINQAPVATPTRFFVADSTGEFLVLNKEAPQIRYQYRTEAPLAAPLAQHGEMVYAACLNSRVYAVDADGGRVLWQFSLVAPATHRPAVTDEDVFVTNDTEGLFRINRQTGEAIWQNRDARRFLAANRDFVYAVNQAGFLLVLDRPHGIRMATLDTHDYTVPIANDLTDRIYLGANDGLVICLRARELVQPLRVRRPEEVKPPPEAASPIPRKPPARPKPAAPAEKDTGTAPEKDTGAAPEK